MSAANRKKVQHNKLQNRFLDTISQKALIDIVFLETNNKCGVTTLGASKKDKIVFATTSKWDFELEHESDSVDVTKTGFVEHIPELLRGYKEENKLYIYAKCTIRCKICPILDDNYIEVLKKMKAQIVLSKKTNAKKWHDENEKRFVILLVETFASHSADVHQLRTIFLQADIRIVFVSELDQAIKDIHEREGHVENVEGTEKEKEKEETVAEKKEKEKEKEKEDDEDEDEEEEINALKRKILELEERREKKSKHLQ